MNGHTDYTRITYFFLAVAVLIVTTACIAVWALLRLAGSFETVKAAAAMPFATAASISAAVMAHEAFTASFTEAMLGTLGAISLLGFLFCLTLGIRVAQFNRKNDEFKSQLISIASHQLKTPIAVARGYTDLLEHSEGLSQNQKDMLLKMDANNQRMLQTVNDILDFSRLELGRFKSERARVSLTGIIEQLAAELQPIASRKGIALELLLPEQELFALLDRGRVLQAINNLIDNAIKYAFDATTVTVTLSERNNAAVIDIRNEGIGVPKAEQAKLFSQFYRASNAAKREGGTGLGLFITKSIIEQSGGSVAFISNEGKDTTFTVQFPIAKA